MTKLSVNINKIATIRNARGGKYPCVVKAAINCQKFGADGITVHPRPDERHITYDDVFKLKEVVCTEYNIEGYPLDRFINMVIQVKPDQVTLVPDKPNVITSNNGWNTVKNRQFLTDIISEFNSNKIRTSIFVNPEIDMIEGAKLCGADRIELYTESYANLYERDKNLAIHPFKQAAEMAFSLEIGVNAGHDLNLNNLHFFNAEIKNLLEVSIGHAIISDAIYSGLENTIQLYKRQL